LCCLVESKQLNDPKGAHETLTKFEMFYRRYKRLEFGNRLWRPPPHVMTAGIRTKRARERSSDCSPTGRGNWPVSGRAQYPAEAVQESMESPTNELEIDAGSSQVEMSVVVFAQRQSRSRLQSLADCDHPSHAPKSKSRRTSRDRYLPVGIDCAAD